MSNPDDDEVALSAADLEMERLGEDSRRMPGRYAKGLHSALTIAREFLRRARVIRRAFSMEPAKSMVDGLLVTTMEARVRLGSQYREAGAPDEADVRSVLPAANPGAGPVERRRDFALAIGVYEASHREVEQLTSQREAV